jgi:formamidopyrimidine-DNA glycosylase
MPELPEVETIARDLSKTIAGKRLLSAQVFREDYLRGQSVEVFVKSIEKHVVEVILRRGKYLLWIFDDCAMLAHLGMTGKFIKIAESEPLPKHTIAKFDFTEAAIIFHDIRRFGRLKVYNKGETIAELVNLGPEPFSPNFNASQLLKRFASLNRAIKEILLDQSIVAGIGNIYASEILFIAKIHPLKAGKVLSLSELQKIVTATRKILSRAIAQSGTTISNYKRIDDQSGQFQNFLQVYGRQGQPCILCGSEVQRLVQSGRSVFFCPKCQTL